jgi:hypothetical protein
MATEYNPKDYSPALRDFANYKLAIAGCSRATVNEYMRDIRAFFQFVIADRTGIDPTSDEFSAPTAEESSAATATSSTSAALTATAPTEATIVAARATLITFLNILNLLQFLLLCMGTYSQYCYYTTNITKLQYFSPHFHLFEYTILGAGF